VRDAYDVHTFRDWASCKKISMKMTLTPHLTPDFMAFNPMDAHTLSRTYGMHMRACTRATDNMMENEFHKWERRYVPQDTLTGSTFLGEY
jgi:hypothetical protein